MSAGEPLTDEDHQPWLDTMASWIQEHRLAGRPSIITCSASKRAYRDILGGDDVVFVHLTGSNDHIGRRLLTRHDHFMPTSLLDSQVATLEPLTPDERGLVVGVGGKPARQAARVIDELRLRPEQGSAQKTPVRRHSRDRPVNARRRPPKVPTTTGDD